MPNIETVLRCLSPEEATSLNGSNVVKFLKSPYHNSRRDLLPYFKYIIRFYPEFKDSKYTTDNICSKLKINKSAIPGLRTSLKSKIKEYLIYENLKRKEDLMLHLSIDEFSKRKNFELFYSLINAEIIRLLNIKDKTFDDYLKLRKLLHQLCSHPELPRQEAFKFIELCMQNLDYFFILLKMLYSTQYLTLSNLKNKEKEIYLLDECIEVGSNTSLAKTALYKQYLFIINFLRETSINDTYSNLNKSIIEFSKRLNIETFNEFKKQFILSRNNVSRYHRMNIIVHLINYCNILGTVDVKIIFELIKFRCEEDLLLINDQLDINAFFNVVSAAVANNEYAWTEKFITVYIPYINSDYRNDVLKIATAYIKMSQRKFGLAFSLLNNISTNEYIIKVRLYAMKIRCLLGLSIHQQNRTDDAERKINNFRAYLRNRELNEKTKDGYINFCNICRKIIKWVEEKIIHKREKNVQLLNDIEQEVQSMEQLKFRDWLLSFINDFLK